MRYISIKCGEVKAIQIFSYLSPVKLVQFLKNWLEVIYNPEGHCSLKFLHNILCACRPTAMDHHRPVPRIRHPLARRLSACGPS